MFKIKSYARIIAYHPCIVSWFYLKGIAWTKGCLFAISSFYDHLTGNNITDMGRGPFARLFTHMLRPYPAR